MLVGKAAKLTIAGAVALALGGCGLGNSSAGSGFGSASIGRDNRADDRNEVPRDFDSAAAASAAEKGDTIWDLFRNNDDPNITLRVNKYLWNASLDVLSFMPVQRADPFTGTISMGYGRPQGGGRAYRATVYVTDPALDARSLRVALQGAGGSAVSTETVRKIEDAILTRARQLRIRDTKL